MKKLYFIKVLFFPIILIAVGSVSIAQCPAGYSSATANWDQLDYLTRSGTYASFVTNAMMQTQNFTIGRNRFSINFPLATMSTTGENATNTAELGSFATGEDVEYSGNGIITINFTNIVYNLQFSLYDIDNLQSVQVSAMDGSLVPLNISMSAAAVGIVNVSGSGGISPTGTAINSAALNTDNRGTVNISIAGNSPGIANGIKSVTINLGIAGGTAGNFWLSDITACTAGSFPLNYYISQQPFTGQPAYYLVTPDNNSVYLFNPLTGKADWLFSEPGSPWVNSMAYDHVNKILYYVMDNPSPSSSNKSLKRYNFNTESISTVIADVSSLGIPLFDIVVESAGAAFYDGSLFLGIEGTNGAKNSNRESIIWRIDFDASQNPIRSSQVFARPADNGSGTLTHDWGDFSIKDGSLYDFNTGNVGSTSQFIHLNMQNGNATFFNTSGNPAPIQVGQIWNGTLYWTGGKPGEGGRVAVYNENGTIGPKTVASATVCSPAWVGQAGDASDPFRPKSDFGDAPASYDPVAMDKATHEYDCNLRLGPTFDREWDKTSSPTATADGSDEDGIGVATLLPNGIITYVQDVKVYNNTGSNATLTGWLDYDADGIFEPAEGVSIIVASSGSMQTKTLAWPGIPVSLPIGSTTFLRIRLTSASNGMTVNNATRWFANGEVEDYAISINSILPVEILSFIATAEKNSNVILNWGTGKEVDFRGFDIERSEDGLTWSSMAFVQSHSNGGAVNNYSFYDYNPLSGRSYYRLKLLSKDGNFKYSAVRTIILGLPDNSFKITPNPVRDQSTLQFVMEKNEPVNIYIIDAGGKRVWSKMAMANPGINQVSLHNLGGLTPGVYVVQLVTGSKNLNTKITVQ
ncbi:MAG: T9SS type A sorting domain-containing protein [Chitinophagaceae bacterium]|nr:T9SS type A sorting domain-containing protein [Chitinophagaceae bacterium]